MRTADADGCSENSRLLAGPAPEEVGDSAATSFNPISTQQFFQQARTDYDGAERMVTVYKCIMDDFQVIPICCKEDDDRAGYDDIKFPFKRTGACCLCSGGVMACVGWCCFEAPAPPAYGVQGILYMISPIMGGIGVLCCLIGCVGAFCVPICCFSCDSVPSLEEAPEEKNVILIGPSRRITDVKYEGAARLV